MHPITGARQASIASNIQAWVDRFDFADSMLLDTPAILAKQTANGWMVTTPRQVYFSRFLVSATGGHYRAFMAEIERVSSSIQEFHSSSLHEPHELAGKDGLVVGGGASAYDLLDLCFEHKARRVAWVYRTLNKRLSFPRVTG